MRMRVVIIGEYDLTDSLTERINYYGTADPIECAKVDMEVAISHSWIFMGSLDTLWVAGIEPVNE